MLPHIHVLRVPPTVLTTGWRVSPSPRSPGAIRAAQVFIRPFTTCTPVAAHDVIQNGIYFPELLCFSSFMCESRGGVVHVLSVLNVPWVTRPTSGAYIKSKIGDEDLLLWT